MSKGRLTALWRAWGVGDGEARMYVVVRSSAQKSRSKPWPAVDSEGPCVGLFAPKKEDSRSPTSKASW